MLKTLIQSPIRKCIQSCQAANLGDTKGALESYNKALKLLENVARERPEALDVRREVLNIYRRIGECLRIHQEYGRSASLLCRRPSVRDPYSQKPDDDEIVRSACRLYQAQGRNLRLVKIWPARLMPRTGRSNSTARWPRSIRMIC